MFNSFLGCTLNDIFSERDTCPSPHEAVQHQRCSVLSTLVLCFFFLNSSTSNFMENPAGDGDIKFLHWCNSIHRKSWKDNLAIYQHVISILFMTNTVETNKCSWPVWKCEWFIVVAMSSQVVSQVAANPGYDLDLG